MAFETIQITSVANGYLVEINTIMSKQAFIAKDKAEILKIISDVI